jgi:hypothetical protein
VEATEALIEHGFHTVETLAARKETAQPASKAD